MMNFGGGIENNILVGSKFSNVKSKGRGLERKLATKIIDFRCFGLLRAI